MSEIKILIFFVIFPAPLANIGIFFGAGKLRNIGGDLGSAVKSFKEGMSNPKRNVRKKKAKK